MKKMIAVALTLAMMAAFCLNASAASITKVVEFEENANVSFTEIAEDAIVTLEEVLTDIQAVLTFETEDVAEIKALLEELGVDVTNLKILDEKQVSGDISAENPFSTTITLNGIQAGTPVVVLFKTAQAGAVWQILTVGVAPEVEITLVSEGTLVITIE